MNAENLKALMLADISSIKLAIEINRANNIVKMQDLIGILALNLLSNRCVLTNDASILELGDISINIHRLHNRIRIIYARKDEPIRRMIGEFRHNHKLLDIEKFLKANYQFIINKI